MHEYGDERIKELQSYDNIKCATLEKYIINMVNTYFQDYKKDLKKLENSKNKWDNWGQSYNRDYVKFSETYPFHKEIVEGTPDQTS